MGTSRGYGRKPGEKKPRRDLSGLWVIILIIVAMILIALAGFIIATHGQA